jgi:hypothetical protein
VWRSCATGSRCSISAWGRWLSLAVSSPAGSAGPSQRFKPCAFKRRMLSGGSCRAWIPSRATLNRRRSGRFRFGCHEYRRYRTTFHPQTEPRSTPPTRLRECQRRTAARWFASRCRRPCLPEGVSGAVELVGTSTLRDTLQATAVHGPVRFTGRLSDQWTVPDFYSIDYLPSRGAAHGVLGRGKRLAGRGPAEIPRRCRRRSGDGGNRTDLQVRRHPACACWHGVGGRYGRTRRGCRLVPEHTAGVPTRNRLTGDWWEGGAAWGGSALAHQAFELAVGGVESSVEALLVRTAR